MYFRTDSARNGIALVAFLSLMIVGMTLGRGAETASAVATPTAPGAESEAPSSGSIDLAFVTHLDAGLPEQDIYVEREEGSNEVWRVTSGDHDMSQPLYRTAVSVDHDPFNPDALGPFPKGEAFGFTLGQWLAQRGTGTYTCEAGTGTMDATFAGLVPNGVYTMWHAFMAMPPTTPFAGTLDLPLGARDGSDSVFHADSEGSAHFVREFQPCLEMSDVHTTAMLAVNYHSDGKTYRAYPGEFGLNAHIPLFVMLPNRDGIQ